MASLSDRISARFLVPFFLKVFTISNISFVPARDGWWPLFRTGSWSNSRHPTNNSSYTRAHTHTEGDRYQHTHTQTHTHRHTHTHRGRQTSTHIHTRASACTHTHTQRETDTHTHTNYTETYTNKHAHQNNASLLFPLRKHLRYSPLFLKFLTPFQTLPSPCSRCLSINLFLHRFTRLLVSVHSFKSFLNLDACLLVSFFLS